MGLVGADDEDGGGIRAGGTVSTTDLGNQAEDHARRALEDRGYVTDQALREVGRGVSHEKFHGPGPKPYTDSRVFESECPMPRTLPESERRLRFQLWLEKLTDKEMADLCGITRSAMSQWRRKHDLPPSPRSKAADWRTRFWHYVDETVEGECWGWDGPTTRHGYGKLGMNGTEERAHRVSYRLEYGHAPDDLYVLHRCDNPPCVNPDHLYVGTAADNTADAINRGRWDPSDHDLKGETHGQAKLSKDQVLDIREQHQHGSATLQELADRYGVTKSAIRKVVTGENWSHL